MSNVPDARPTAGRLKLGPNLVSGNYLAGTIDYSAVAVAPGSSYAFSYGNARRLRTGASNPPAFPLPTVPATVNPFVATDAFVYFEPAPGLVGQPCTATLRLVL
jgi:hypothetical protein